MLDIDIKFAEHFPKLANKFSLKPFQEKVIANVIENGNTLCIMPTGGGKSLIYWMSGLLLGGITIVISPLIALIDEQTEKIKEQGFEVLTIHGGMDSKKQAKILIDFASGRFNPKFIFVSPEKIATDGLFEYCIIKRRDDISMFAIDEVHCVSQWGISFRPFYKHIPDFISRVFVGEEMPKILALTATLNPKEVGDICNEFKIISANIIRDYLLIRSEISLKVLKFNKEDEKEAKLWDLIKMHRGEKILVFVYRIASERGVEKFSEKAEEKGYKSVCFHGEMSASDKKDIIENYKNNNIDIIFATNAFGMGIDIPDIRTIIHYMIPESVEQYYQEIGRAARDKKSANAYLLYSNRNIDVKRKWFIDGSFPKEDKLNASYKKATRKESGLKTLPYFEDEDIQKCLPYFLDCGIINILCKGFSDFKGITSTSDNELESLINSTKTRNLITTIKKSAKTAQEIVEKTYECVVDGKAVLSKPLDRRLIIDVKENEIDDDKMNSILDSIEEKRAYKHRLLDYLIFLIDDNISSNELHQEIGRYLGVDRHQLGRIYSTTKGDLVRSKSEVIIANLLHQNDIKYEYEKKLEYDSGKWIEPDFTIIFPDGKDLYWEHLGMLGIESYDKRWLEKKDIYENHFNGCLVVTYEGATITDSTVEIIKKIKGRQF